MDDDQKLIEIEELLRTMPARETLRHDTPENFAWFGRASALVDELANPIDSASFTVQSNGFQRTPGARKAATYLRQMMIVIHKIRAELLMRTRGPLTTAIGKGMVFDYFDEMRRIVETAKQDIFFVDPYLDAEFVARYLPHITAGVPTRLLAREKLSTLLPAVRQFVAQHSADVETRSASGFHDRYIIVDRTYCYQSGASFKDGARSSPTTLTQITDAFPAVLQTYEQFWVNGKVEK